MIGQSHAFLKAQRLIDKIARCDAPVLIEGETGTGKELAAREIHYGGSKRDGPFVPVNCGAIPGDLVENELFGHRRGAFTDAHVEQVGLVAHAGNGTLFLDEIDALPLKAQVSLLRFLQDHQYRPLGGPESRYANVRLIAATNSNLATLAQQGAFRLDLLFRLRVMCVTLPPLRERQGDVALLADAFLKTCVDRFEGGAKAIHPVTLDWMNAYAWPGNIRELENLICREYLLADEHTIRIDPPTGCDTAVATNARVDLPALSIVYEDFKTAKSRVIAEFESRYLAYALHAAGGNITRAATLAGKERRAFGKLLKKHGIERAGSGLD
ncbi:sigma-54 dependent transcriptional regulator [Caballeronia sp. SEWSISQ10-4 2]|uniref:sigma 54-interacting transcriptional regulator n=1 Tax=Caballeronia sp. SEWSISQ10-4 2 TaxID=2937438 RepID=UPI00264D9822|nr:sigma-54 dependent transcriptional regulator [Caballeronia sp. SEWSISQ10-4 2]MDN7179616.1 sigma-54 dependent transcriptional regulator [Caballeronia sp. SEWSISQ10-4 2]